jgi:hypothetical protein
LAHGLVEEKMKAGAVKKKKGGLSSERPALV